MWLWDDFLALRTLRNKMLSSSYYSDSSKTLEKHLLQQECCRRTVEHLAWIQSSEHYIQIRHFFFAFLHINTIATSCTVLSCVACVNWFHCTGSHWVPPAVVWNLMVRSYKMILKQTAKSLPSPLSSLSLPLSPVISISHLRSLSILSTLLQFCPPICHLTCFLPSQSSHTSCPPLPLSVHPDIYATRVCMHEQLVVQWILQWIQ